MVYAFINLIMMNKKEEFLKDKKECTETLSKIMESNDETLKEINDFYGAADILSIKNKDKFSKILLQIAFVGTLLTIAFLLYDEAELYGMIIACGILIICIFLINNFSKRLDCHRKYLEYRVLAEALRIQFYMYYSGSKTRITELFPWSYKLKLTWILEIINEIKFNDNNSKKPILDCWIKDQKAYHEKALLKSQKQDNINKYVTKVVFVLTLVTYLFALLFELFIYKSVDVSRLNFIRAFIKVLLGSLSAITLFTNNYYGKMSLSNIIDDHKKMIALYDDVEKKIEKEGEKEELILYLAKESINENSSWYAYESSNNIEMNI